MKTFTLLYKGDGNKVLNGYLTNSYKIVYHRNRNKWEVRKGKVTVSYDGYKVITKTKE